MTNFQQQEDIDPEVRWCAEILKMKSDGLTETQIAEHYGKSRETIWRKKQQWQKSGVMTQAMQLLASGQLHSYQAAQMMVLDNLKAIVKRQVEHALGNLPKSSRRTELEAAAWLVNFAKTILEGVSQSDQSAGDYANDAEQTFDPMRLPVIEANATISKSDDGSVNIKLNK